MINPGELAISHKEPEGCLWPPIVAPMNCLFHELLYLKGRHLYPNGVGWAADHVRGGVGIRGCTGFEFPNTFEFTYPRAKYQVYYDWMDKPTYATVVTLNYPIWNDLSLEEKAKLLQVQCDKWEGTLYDVGQLVDIWIGWHRVLDFSKRRKVCSVGWRIIHEKVLSNLHHRKINLFPEVDVEKTIPCCFLNSPWYRKKEL